MAEPNPVKSARYFLKGTGEMNERPFDLRALEDWSHDMKRDWDDRARRDAKWFINPFKYQQTDAEFDQSGELSVKHLILDDLDLLAPDADPKTLRVLELGSGIGRMTKFLARQFGEVHATDVSGEMIRQARTRLAAFENVKLHETSGYDFADLPDAHFDIIFSAFVFQHVPTTDIIRSNLHDAYRLLKPGGVFKFQTNSLTAFDFEEIEKDTWMGASLPESDIRRFAEDVDASIISLDGRGSTHCWTILRKPETRASRTRTGASIDIVFHGRTDLPSQRQIPLSGAHTSLTLLVTGLDVRSVDCNSVCTDISGLEVLPQYVGPVRPHFAYLMDGLLPLTEDLTRIDVTLPVGAPTGAAEVRVQLTSGETSAPVLVEFVVEKPVIPQIVTVMDANNGAGRGAAAAPESTLRLEVEGLNEAADCGNIRVQIGDRILKPTQVSALEGRGLHRVDVYLPTDLAAGKSEATLYFGTIGSPPVTFEILPSPQNN